MNKTSIILFVMSLFVLTACQDKDIDRDAMVLAAPDASQITGSLTGDDYTWTWPSQTHQMRVTIYRNGTLSSNETVTGNSFTHKNVPTNVPFEYVFKVTDGTNLSKGVLKSYTREGATSISGVQMRQVDKAGGYDAVVEWEKATDATSIKFTATNGSKTINETLAGTATQYVISDVSTGDTWDVTLVASNDKGTALPTRSSLRIGKTAIGFLSIYATPEELVANGDDDEASAWLWLHENYPTAAYVYFGNVKTEADVEPYRVLRLRDLENVGEDQIWSVPEVVEAATPVIREWYKKGGSLLLWSHATTYIGHLGRINLDDMKANDHAIGAGAGGYNPDTWRMAVQLNPYHASPRTIQTILSTRAWKWNPTTARNSLPSRELVGRRTTTACSSTSLRSGLELAIRKRLATLQVTQTFGIYPLGTWDSQIDWVSQLNVWEAQQGNTDFQGTVLCIGNGGCEFSMKNPDGTPDKSAHPKNNPYQDNVLTLAKNSLEYLKTR